MTHMVTVPGEVPIDVEMVKGEFSAVFAGIRLDAEGVEELIIGLLTAAKVMEGLERLRETN